ncbi:MAG: Re/Si-specific NAD(P)(+) transhydrogenase subunit alpha [Acidobacteriota bacterium]|nr:Re/Si-specific NAD(P)(+) transhydrogenase subunit alpha [Acidobacteriota bacterium]
MAQIFVPREIRELEKRVAATPETVKKLVKAGFAVVVERGAGSPAFIGDADFEEAGATFVDSPAEGYGKADLIFKVDAPLESEVEMIKEGAVLITHIVPSNELPLVKQLCARKISTFSMNLVPRITIAQKMDSLSSQASIAGYKAVLLGANALGKYFPLLMTAAGTITPAKVVILGAGVAGLQAIATARRLGATVEASDVRLAVKEQIESLGAKFIMVETDEDMEDQGGYAKEQSEDFLRRQREEVGKRMAQADVVITTALIPGRPAPVLINEDIVKQMPEGSVIVDLAVQQGGNCELAEPGKTVVKHGVTIIGELNLPAMMQVHASQLYARNLLNLVTHIAKEGELVIDLEEPVTDGALLTHDGAVRHEPTKKLLDEGGN